MNKPPYFWVILILAIAGISVVLYFNFTAEDAFITYRYAENLISIGSLVYNEGEPINALTSPLHAILSAALFYVTGHTVLSNKIVALFLLVVSAIVVWHRFKDSRQLQPLALGLMLMPPSVLLWTLGGLETPILLFLATVTVFLVDGATRFRPFLLFVVFLLASLAFLTRYDSVLFFIPIVVYASSKVRAFNHVVLAVVGAVILPLAWFVVSALYYGDLLPTSFYVKTPSANVDAVIFNGIYVVSYLLFVGLIPAFILAFFVLRSKYRIFQLLYWHLKRMWWLYLGIMLELSYGLTMATHHMMFSFRFFVPYIPATVILVVDLIRFVSQTDAADLSSPGTARLLAGFLLTTAFFQLYQNAYTYTHSVNGIAPIGEYRELGVRDYVEFIETLEQEAHDIERHWSAQELEPKRLPRIITYAAGALPYTFRDSYVYEKLVSYRHCQQRFQQGLHADYIHIVTPRHGEVEEQLPKPADSYSLVSSYDMLFDGSRQWFLVYFNPQPEHHNLGPTIDFACRSVL